MSDRQLVLEAVRQMPARASFDEILDEIALLASVNRGLAQAERGEGVPHEEAVKRFRTWTLKFTGRQKRRRVWTKSFSP
jgi:predicted transcriptional regulator